MSERAVRAPVSPSSLHNTGSCKPAARPTTVLFHLPFLDGLSDNGSIRYTLNALLPFLMLLSLTSSISGKEFIAHRKFAFHVFGSALSTPGWYFPKTKENKGFKTQEEQSDRKCNTTGSLQRESSCKTIQQTKAKLDSRNCEKR